MLGVLDVPEGGFVIAMSHRPRNRQTRVPFADLVDLVAEEIPPATQAVDLDLLRTKVCVPKIRYGKASARAVANRQSQERRRRLSHYHCPFCDSYHVGHVASIEWLRVLAATLRSRTGVA